MVYYGEVMSRNKGGSEMDRATKVFTSFAKINRKRSVYFFNLKKAKINLKTSTEGI